MAGFTDPATLKLLLVDCGKVSAAAAAPDYAPTAADWTRSPSFGSPLRRSNRLFIRAKAQLIDCTSFPSLNL
jgi:hypothetical protein